MSIWLKVSYTNIETYYYLYNGMLTKTELKVSEWIFIILVHVHDKSLQSCPTLCECMDGSPAGSFVHGILQARYWSGLTFLSSGDLPDPGTEPESLTSPALGGGFFNSSATWEAPLFWLLLLLLLLLSHVICVQLCDPTDGSPPGSRPWDSPGKNTGVGCHFLLQCMKVTSEQLNSYFNCTVGRWVCIYSPGEMV